MESGHRAVRNTRNSQKWRRKVFGSMSSEMMKFINGAVRIVSYIPPKIFHSSPPETMVVGRLLSFSFGFWKGLCFRGEVLDISGVYLSWVTCGKDWSKTTHPLYQI